MRYLVPALSAVSLILLAYVAYLHLAGASTLTNRLAAPLIEQFDSGAFDSGFDLTRDGDCSARVRSGKLAIRGNGTGCRVSLKGPPLRLTDMVAEARFQFTGSSSPADITVGFENPEDPPRHIAVAAMHTGDDNHVRLMGHDRSEGPIDRDRHAPEVTNFERTIQVEPDEGWHTMTMRLSPDVAACLISVDGIARATAPCFWHEGAAIRPVLTISGREGADEIAVDIDEIRFDEIAPPMFPVDIHETFRGAVFDPRIWRVGRQPASIADETIGTGEDGLWMRARLVNPDSAPSSANWISGPTVDLRSFRLRVEYEIRNLRNARFYVGVTNIRFQTPMWHVWDVSITGNARGELRSSFVGHWSNRGHFDEINGEEADISRGTIEMTFDEETREGVAHLNGVEVGRRVLDLQPLEPMQVHFGGHLLGARGEYDLVMTSLDFEQVR